MRLFWSVCVFAFPDCVQAESMRGSKSACVKKHAFFPLSISVVCGCEELSSRRYAEDNAREGYVRFWRNGEAGG